MCNVNTHKTTLDADNIICISVFYCSSLSMISKSYHNNVKQFNTNNAMATKYFIICIQEVLGINSDVLQLIVTRFLNCDTIS